MKICHIQYSFAIENGGPTRSLSNYCCGQVADGHRVSLWTLEGFPQWSAAIRLPPPVEMRVFQVEPPTKLGRSTEMRLQLRLAESPDIYHLHGAWLQAMRYGADEARRRNKPYMLELAGMYEPLGLRQKWLPKQVARWWFQDRILHDAACLHVNSAQEAENIRKLGFRTPIAVIPVGVDIQEIEKRKAEMLPGEVVETFTGQGKAEIQKAWTTDNGRQTTDHTHRLPPPISDLRPPISEALHGRPFILYLSRVHPKKGLDLLIRAFAQNRKSEIGNRKSDDWRLVIAGSGVPEYIGRCRKLAAESGIAERCLWLGHVDEAQKNWLFTHAHCYVLPTSSENFGNVVAEALAHGTPVITTIHTPWKDLKERGCGWYVDNTESEIGQALREALALDPVTRASMGEAAKQLVRDRYSLGAVLSDINSVYKWLAGGGDMPACVLSDTGRTPEARLSQSKIETRCGRHTEVMELFDEKAAKWDGKYGPNGALRPRLFSFEKELLERVKPPAAVLDFGCGTGNLACHLSSRGYSVSGCDISHEMVAWALKKAPRAPVAWHILPVGWLELPFVGDSFEAVTASSVFEYVANIDVALAALWRVLKPGGFLLATVPDCRHFIRKLENRLKPVAAAAVHMPVLRRSQRLKSYETYLRCSVNRMPLEDWFDCGRQAGFETVARDRSLASKAMLVMLVFRKPTAGQV